MITINTTSLNSITDNDLIKNSDNDNMQGTNLYSTKEKNLFICKYN